MKRRIVLVLSVLFVVVLVAGCGIVPGRTHSLIIGGDSTIRAGQVIDEPLTVVGGNVTLEEGSRLTSDLFVAGGNVRAFGEIDRDVHVYGGNLTLGSTAVVRGDVFQVGGNVSRAPGAQIEGQISPEGAVRIPWIAPFGRGPSFLGSLAWLLFRSLALAALAVVAVTLWPQPTSRVARAAEKQPLVAGLLGIIAYVVAPLLFIFLAITIILIPFSLLGILLLVVAAVFGWIAVGLDVGQRLVRAFNWDLQPAIVAGVGTLVLSLVVDGVGLIPFVGWALPFVVSSLGLGSVLLTRFGTREYVPSTGARLPPTAPGERSAPA